MTLRILWCNYERWFKDIEVLDPEQEELKEMNDKNKQQEQQEIVIQEIKL